MKVGSRPGQVEGESVLYVLTMKGKAALRLDEKSVETLLKTATDDRLGSLSTTFDDFICGMFMDL